MYHYHRDAKEYFMSKGFLPMIVTTAGAVGVYYLWSVKLGFNDTAGVLLGIAVAIILSVIFTKFKNGEK